MILRKSTVFMFSGQGSQYYQMGLELFNSDPTFRSTMIALDDMVCKLTKNSILERLYNPQNTKDKLFDEIIYTHPAIFMVEYSIALSLIKNNIKPDYVLGASLGEFVSLAVSGVVSVEEAIELVIYQAGYILSECKNGNMIAIINDIELFFAQPILHTNSELVSVNNKSHFVISAGREASSKILTYLGEQGIIHQMLPVRYAFHSRGIDNAKFLWQKYLQTKKYKSPRIPYVSCVAGRVIDKISRDYLWNVIRMPILFTDALKHIDEERKCIFIDLGPSGTLSNFAEYNLDRDSGNEVFSIMTPFSQDIANFNRVLRRYSEIQGGV